MFHHVAQLPSQFCQTPISQSRIGQLVELLKSKSIQPRSQTTRFTLYHQSGHKLISFQLRHLQDNRLQSAKRVGGADSAEGLLLPPRPRLRRGHRHAELGRSLLRLLRPQHSLPLSGEIIFHNFDDF